MAYEWATWLAPVLREAGLSVVEEDGWRTRGLSTSQSFVPRHLVWHHDASAVGPSPGVPSYMIRNWSNAGAQLWVCLGCNGAHKVGTWHLVGAGRAAHAGVVRSGAPTNHTSLGVETDHTTGEAWHPDLLKSLRVGSAAIFNHLKRKPGGSLHFHKSICYPAGRKVDPDKLVLKNERRRVRKAMKELKGRKAVPTVSVKRARRAAKRAGWARVFMSKRLRQERKIIKKALKAEGVKTWLDWEKRVAKKPNALPNRRTLRLLGDRAGFRVVD